MEIDGVYRAHIAMVRGRARRLLGHQSAAEDAAQEAFMRLMRVGAGLENPAGFLYRTVTNLCLNLLRDKKRQRELLELHGAEAAPGPAAGPPDEALVLRKVLAAAPEEEALIAAYYFVDGLEHAEIAELLSMERRTVGRRLERFRARARALLEEAV